MQNAGKLPSIDDMQEDLYRIAPAGSPDIDDIVRLFHEYESHIGVDLSYQDFASELSTLPGKYAPPAGQLLIARFNVENLLDADYWAGGNGTTTLTGPVG